MYTPRKILYALPIAALALGGCARGTGMFMTQKGDGIERCVDLLDETRCERFRDAMLHAPMPYLVVIHDVTHIPKGEPVKSVTTTDCLVYGEVTQCPAVLAATTTCARAPDEQTRQTLVRATRAANLCDTIETIAR